MDNEEMGEIKEKLREMPAIALIDNLNEMLEDEEISIKVLKLFRDEMIRRKFNSPFGFLVNVSRGEVEEEELGDRKKQNAYFRKMAILKKYALFSTMIAISARRIKQTTESNGYNDLTPFLPINGNYLSNVLQYGYFGLITYRNLYDAIKNTGEEEEAYMYEIEGEDYTYRKKIPAKRKIEEYLNENEKVKGSRKTTIVRSLIRSRFVAKALSSAITGYAGFLSFREAEKTQSKRLAEYNEILKRKGYIPFYVVENYLEVDKALYEDLKKAGFIEENKIAEDIKQEIISKRKEISERMEKISKLMFVVPLAKHYLLKNKMQRKMKPLFPSIANEPSEKQLKVLSIANQYIGFPIEKAIAEKLKHEDYGDNKTIAYAVVGKKYGVKNSSKFFSVNEDEIVNAINLFSKMQSGRGRDFLEKLKD